ncbi:MAG TPA: hypothetical protein DCX53_00865, partial [Anaerolineae bacterium]|nr:hypothetical protein [Anaerolineae bacterium]
VTQPEGSIDSWNLATRDQVVAFAGGMQDVTSLAVGPSQIVLGVVDKIEILNESGVIISQIDS